MNFSSSTHPTCPHFQQRSGTISSKVPLSESNNAADCHLLPQLVQRQHGPARIMSAPLRRKRERSQANMPAKFYLPSSPAATFAIPVWGTPRSSGPSAAKLLSEPLERATKAGGLAQKTAPLLNNEVICNFRYLAQPVKTILADKRCQLRRPSSLTIGRLSRPPYSRSVGLLTPRRLRFNT